MIYKNLLLLLLFQPVAIHCWIQASPSSFQFVRSIATCCQFFPVVLVILVMSSLHRYGGLPVGLFEYGRQFTMVLVQRSSVILAMCPAQFHFNDAIRSMTSTTFVCCRIH